MISGTHVVVYSKSTDADRTFPAWPPFTVEELQVKFFGNLEENSLKSLKTMVGPWRLELQTSSVLATFLINKSRCEDNSRIASSHQGQHHA
jgi:hypothetical protein